MQIVYYYYKGYFRMSNTHIEQIVCDHLNKRYCFFDDKKIPPECHLITDNYIDSLSVLEIVCFLENTFDISINDKEITLSNFEKINSIISLVQSKS